MANDFNWLKESLYRLEAKQDIMNEVLIENTASLKEHMRRTELLEAEIKPVKDHVKLMNDVAKLISILTAAVLAAHTLGLI